MTSYRSQLAFVAAAMFAADAGGDPAAPAVASTVAEFEFPQFPEGTKFSFDCATIPGDVRLDMLKGAVRVYIANRLNGVSTRYAKDEKVIAWNAYDEASKADPLQTSVAKPEGERPAAPDYADAYARAIKDLTEGNVRKVGAEPKQRAVKDPLVKIVTEVVVREVYDSNRAADPKYSYLTAKKDVGPDGVKYLEGKIASRLADVAEADRPALKAQLEKMLETKYLTPARNMLGINVPKAQSGLPSIL